MHNRCITNNTMTVSARPLLPLVAIACLAQVSRLPAAYSHQHREEINANYGNGGAYRSQASAGLQGLPSGYLQAAMQQSKSIDIVGDALADAIKSYKRAKAEKEFWHREE